jgi:hypothetical protein
MLIVKSPRCDDLVTLPAGLTPDTRVRCPYTKEEFLIQEILDSLPPMLEVIDVPEATAVPAGLAGATEDTLMAEDASTAAAAAEAEAAGDVPAPAGDAMFDFLHGPSATEAEPVAAADTKGPALFEPAGEDAASAVGAVEAGEATAEQAAEATATPARMKMRPRPKKKPKSVPLELIKVVLGGFGGLLIAQIILWWAVPSGCSANPDPIGLAPKLPGFLHWMAPERLRNPETLPPVDAGGATTQQNNGQPDPQAATIQQTPGELAAPFPAAGAGTTSDKGGRDATPEDELAGFGVDLPKFDTDGGGGGPDGLGELQDPRDTQPAGTAPEFLGVLNPPVYDGEQLEAVLTAAKNQRDETETLGGLEGKGLRDVAVFYLPFCRLAERITYVNPNGQNVKPRIEAVEGVLKEIGQSRANLDALGAVTEYWLDMKGPRKSDGILIAGVVQEIKRRGRLHATSVEVFGTDQTVVMVLSRNDPRSKISEGDRVIMLGAMVKDPKDNLGGYDGNEGEVVWGGLPVVLSKGGGGRAGGGGGGGPKRS